MIGFDKLWEIIKRLRDPQHGCPWDLKQTSQSLIPNFIEELYEVIEAIENQDVQHLNEELGDLMLHILMQVRIAEERGDFQLAEVFNTINEKLISRHPHIFAVEQQKDGEALAPKDIKNNWERIKNSQKKRESILDGIPQSMPALIHAQRMQDKAASVGFDWDNIQDVVSKVDEELQELKDAIEKNDIDNIEEEIGDMIFSLVNVARKQGLDSERLLKQASAKFYRRFRKIEQHHEDNDENIYDSNLEKLDELWESSKKDI